jgi:phenylalanyl-tRNA synthetase beta chain
VDPSGVVAAADRACELIAQLGIGQVEPGVIDAYPTPEPIRVIAVRPRRASEMLGFEVTAADVTNSLERLGLLRTDDTDRLAFAIPGRRPDLVREIDLVEEVGRVLGYARIPERLPAGTTTQGGDAPAAAFATRVRRVLVGAGLQEVLTHSLLAPSPLDEIGDSVQRISIRSALSAELSGLRRSLLPGLVDAMERNARRGQGPLWFFEVGAVFQRLPDGYSETASVAGALAGTPTAGWWRRDGSPAAADYFTVRGIVERLIGSTGGAGIEIRPGDDPRLHSGRRADVFLCGRRAGIVGELAPSLATDLTVRDRIVVFELSMGALLEVVQGVQRFCSPSVFPAVTRDLAPRLPRSLPYVRVRDAVTSAGCAILERFDLTDVYTGAPLAVDVQSMTLSFTFRAPDRTLAESDVSEAMAGIRDVLEKQCGATFAG